MNAILDFEHIALAELIWRSPAPQSDRCGVLAQPSRNRGWAGEAASRGSSVRASC